MSDPFETFRPIEIEPGLWRWSAAHPEWRPAAAAESTADWGREVGATFVALDGAAAFIDALAPAEPAQFWRWADERVAGKPVLALSTIGFHRRSRPELVERYGASTSRARDRLPEGIEAIALRGAGEVVFWLPDREALVFGDRVLGEPGGGLRLCPESWLGYLGSSMDLSRLRELLRPLLELPFERVLVSHGEPVLADGRKALQEALG